jgi:predicted HNH restriction endonuclease
MDDAAQRLEGCIDPVYHPVRGENAQDLTLAPFTQNSGHPLEAKYGSLGSGFSEVHHLRPLSQRKSNEPTRLEELSIVCSNCHRMLHRKGLIEPAQLQSMIVAHRKCKA